MFKLFASSLLALVMVSPSHAAGDPEAGKTKAAACAACHGADGNSTIPANPVLAGQHASYLVQQMQDFKLNKRASPVMSGMVAGLSDEDMADIAAWFASQTANQGEAAKDLAEAGMVLYRGGNPDTDVPSCASCHGPSGRGVASAKFPAVSGQHAQYNASELQKFKDGSRSNDYASAMRDIAARMSQAEIDAVSSYMQGLH